MLSAGTRAQPVQLPWPSQHGAAEIPADACAAPHAGCLAGFGWFSDNRTKMTSDVQFLHELLDVTT